MPFSLAYQRLLHIQPWRIRRLLQVQPKGELLGSDPKGLTPKKNPRKPRIFLFRLIQRIRLAECSKLACL